MKQLMQQDKKRVSGVKFEPLGAFYRDVDDPLHGSDYRLGSLQADPSMRAICITQPSTLPIPVLPLYMKQGQMLVPDSWTVSLMPL